MKRSNNHRSVCSLVLAAVLGLGFLSTLAATGCDTSGYYDYSGYVQDAYDYQQSVYDWANQQWDDYIRM